MRRFKATFTREFHITSNRLNKSNYILSKSSFLKLEQCTKAFFLKSNMPFLRDKLDSNKVLTFRRGNEIGELAKQLFPGGTDIYKSSKSTQESIQLTENLLRKKETMYEATFVYEGVLIMVDILTFLDGKWHAFEVKSSLKISETYLIDACLQYFVLKNVLEDLEDFFLVNLNENYVLDGDLNVKKLFKRRSIKAEGEKNLHYFSERVSFASSVLSHEKVPDVSPGGQCFKPYTCDFYGHCWKDITGSDSIFKLPMHRKRLLELFSAGIYSRQTIPREGLTPSEIKILEAFKNKEWVLNEERILSFCSKVKLPAASLDMEIWSAAVPVLQGSRPFQQIPFLFALYSPQKSEYFFTDHAFDQRREFAAKLIEHCKDFESLIIYDQSLEVQVIDQLISLYPDLKEDLEKIKCKFCDISVLIKDFSLYHPAMENNFSLKSIASIIQPHLQFNKIDSGLQAMAQFEAYRNSTNEIERLIMRDEIIAYCLNDSKAAYAIYRFMRERK